MTLAEKYDLVLEAIQTTAVILGFYFAYRQLYFLQKDLHNSVELAARQNAMNLMARYSDPSLVKLRSQLRADRESLEARDNYYDCIALLNFFEEIAIATKHGTASPVILKDSFATSLRTWLEEASVINAMKRARSKDRARFENLLDLYDEWGGNNIPTRRVRQVEPLFPGV